MIASETTVLDRAIALGRLKSRLYETMTPQERELWNEWHHRMLSKNICLSQILDAIEALKAKDNNRETAPL